MSQESAIVLPDWQQPVVKMPLTQAFPDLAGIKEFKSKVCLFSHDRTRVFDVVSPRYQLVEHRHVVARLQKALETYFGTSADKLQFNIRSLRGGAAIRGEVRLPIPTIKLGPDDVSELTLVMRNSYDRSCLFSANLGAFRFICSNGMVIGESFGKISSRHIGSENPELTDGNDTILDQLGQIVARAPMVRELWQEWQDKPVTRDEAMALIEPMKLPKVYADPIFDEGRWSRGRNMWQFYNDMTHMSTHLTKGIARRMEFDQHIAAIFYGDVDVEDLALEEA